MVKVVYQILTCPFHNSSPSAPISPSCHTARGRPVVCCALFEAWGTACCRHADEWGASTWHYAEPRLPVPSVLHSECPWLFPTVGLWWQDHDKVALPTVDRTLQPQHNEYSSGRFDRLSCGKSIGGGHGGTWRSPTGNTGWKRVM